MEIDINQKKITIGDKYQIFIDGKQTHHASAKLFRLFAEINLFDNVSDRHKYTLKKKLTFLKTSFDLTRWDGHVMQFRTISFWKKHYFCKVEKDMFELYGHRGRKYSIYKNNRQIAWWDKQAVSWFNGDNYKIIADNDCDAELLISFCLVIDNAFSDKNEAVKIDIGHIGPQAKKFDPEWRPK